MRKFIFDLETDNLLPAVTKTHCAVLVDTVSEEVHDFAFHRPNDMRRFLDVYRDPQVGLVGHNAIAYDCAVISKLYELGIDKGRVEDTLVLGRLIHADIKTSDFERSRRWKAYEKCTDEGHPWLGQVPLEFPGKLIGSHGLKAWGYRMGLHKGEYDGGWESWSPEMHDYMIQDGRVTLELFKRLMAHQPSAASVELEHRIAWLCAKIERNGFPFDVPAATELLARLVDERELLRRELVGLFPNWMERLPDFIPKRNNRTQGYIAGVPVERWREHEFNPSSRDHIADRLQAKYGWEPTEHTDGGKAKVDDEVLSKLPYPEAQKLARSFLLDKRIGSLAEGSQAWLNVARNGRIHASYNPNGTPHGRASHSRPNISAVPRVSSEFGRDCRALFTVPPGWVLLGADQQGIQLRCLASDLSLAGDEGAYVEVVTKGDPHSSNQAAAGLPTRDKAKTFIYAFLFGAQPPLIGEIAGGGASLGKRLIKSFTERTPGLRKLVATVQAAATGRGWLKGIDGRKVPVKSAHSALNYRLASQEAVICKRWGCDWEDELLAQGLKHGWDGDFAFVSWSHDEYQVAVRDDPQLIETVKAAAVTTGRAAGQPYNFQCPTDVETKVGLNWAETH